MLVEARRKALTASLTETFGNNASARDPVALGMIEDGYEIRALARDIRTCKHLEKELKRRVKDQRGADPRTRGQLQVIKQLTKQLTARLQLLDGKTPSPFPCGNVLPSDHGHTRTPAGGRMYDHITDDELNAMFPPLI